MFHFPAFPPTSLYIQLAVTHHEDEPGFPIRKSSDHSPVIGSPRLIADSHVLHRLLVPSIHRVPLTTYKQSKKKSQKTHHTPTQKKGCTAQFPEDARVHYTVLKQQTTPPPSTREKPPAPAPASHTDHTACSPKTQQRTSMAPPQTRKHDIPPMSKPPTRHSRAAWPTKQ